MGLASAKGLAASESVIGMGVSVHAASIVTMFEALVSIGISAMIVPIAMAVPAIAATIPTTIPVPRWMAPVIPRARSDEDAVYEILRSVVAIRSTGIRIIVVISVRANWRA
jgi:hypothetical protein